MTFLEKKFNRQPNIKMKYVKTLFEIKISKDLKLVKLIFSLYFPRDISKVFIKFIVN